MGLGWLYNDLKEEKFDAVAAFQPTFRSRFLCWRFRLAGIKAATSSRTGGNCKN